MYYYIEIKSINISVIFIFLEQIYFLAIGDKIPPASKLLVFQRKACNKARIWKTVNLTTVHIAKCLGIFKPTVHKRSSKLSTMQCVLI